MTRAAVLTMRSGSQPPRFLAFLLLLSLAVVVLAAPARAQIGSDRYSSIVIEAATGRVLSAVNPDELRHPASLTKMMTLYMAFEAMRDRRITLNQSVPVSAHAASQSPSKLGLMPGGRITVEEAILGLVTKSANDAASALGELLGGEETRFAQMMTLRARALGMTSTTFRNASGLPDRAQVTTARDMALLGRRLVHDFPGQYGYFSVPSFRFRGRTIFNHDHLLERYPGTDGIKTGYVEASGFNLVSSVVRANIRLVGVVMGASRPGERDLHMISLLDDAFGRLDVPVATRPLPSVRLASIINTAQAAPARPRNAARWGIQVGAFSTQAAARHAASEALRAADSGEARTESIHGKGHATWRAQVTGLTQSEAANACAALTKHKKPCLPLRPDLRLVASR
jgi:D-alanyl-D-alanine carboxypeptidase